MEGPVVGGEADGMGKEPFLLMLFVMPVIFLAWIFSSFGLKTVVGFVGFFGYLYWINKQLWETEKRRIQFEERKKINAKRALNGGETLRWLNDGLKAMWPICMEKFASEHFFKPMAPWFLNKYKPKFVKEVTLGSLTLGGRPPEFSLIRVLPAFQDGDDVVFVAAMEFLSDKDMNAQMTVRKGGLKATFYISRLCMKGTVKFSVKFVKGWPVLGRVRFSFENTPTVTMTARSSGIDMRLIPGAANWLEETLGTALEQSVVEPYMLVIDMEKLVSNTLFPARPQQGPEEFFCVEHKSGFSPTVLVEILEAGDLKAANGAGLPDPSVEVMLGSHREKTKTLSKTTNPSWTNEVHRIPIVNWELPNLLTMRVTSKPKNFVKSPMELGICSISLKEYRRNGSRHEEKLQLYVRNEPTGWLRVAITVVHLNNRNAQVVEKPQSNVGSQPTTQDIHTVSPPSSSSTRMASTNHTRNSSTETLPQASEEDGTTETIKMPYGGDGAFSIQCPGKEKTLEFPDPKLQKSRGSAAKDRDTDSKAKWSLKWSRKRNTSPSEREMKFNEHAGYSSSLDRSISDRKVYHGAVKMNLELSPEIGGSRDAPDVEPLKLDTVCTQQNPVNDEILSRQQKNPVNDTNLPQELEVEPAKKQNSKNSWWKKLRLRRRKRDKGSTELDLLQPGYDSFEMSDTSATQSFRKGPADETTLKMVGLFEENNILMNGRGSQSCRQDPSHVKGIMLNGSGATSLRFDHSSRFLNTIHEKPHSLVP